MPDTIDPLVAGLRSLQPAVDVTAGRALFDRARSGGTPGVPSRPPERTRWLLAAAIALVIGGVVSVSALSRRDAGGSVAGPGVRADGTEFEVLAVEPSTFRDEEHGWPRDTLLGATSPAKYREHWARLGFATEPPAADLDESVVLLIERPGSSCPDVLDRFTVDGSTWTASFSAPTGACDDIGLTWVYVAGVDRSALGSETTFVVDVSPLAGEIATSISIVVSLTGDEPVAVPDPDFELLAVQATRLPAGTIRTATTGDELASTWADAGLSGAPPTVDFDTSVVALFAQAGNSCADRFVRFDIDGTVRSPVFEAASETCDDIGVVRAYVVAVDRAALGDHVTFRMPGDVTGVTEVTLDFRGGSPDPTAAPAFEVMAVEQTDLPFGDLRAATTETEYAAMWTESNPGFEQPGVDFDRSLAVMFTVPDDACPDVVTGFGTADGWWTPRLVSPSGGCDQPLITWTYVLAVDRAAFAGENGFRLPGSDVYDFPPTELAVSVEAPATSIPGPAATLQAPTGVRVPLPDEGNAAFAITDVGPLWIVNHGGGEVSVLPGWRAEPATADDSALTGVGQLVVRATNGQFGLGHWTFDDHGRALNGPRSTDLVGFAGIVDGNGVEVLRSTPTRIDGDPVAPPGPAEYSGVPELADPVPLGFLGQGATQGWYVVDATVVVQDGVGVLCRDTFGDHTFDELGPCSHRGIATPIRSDEPDVTTWLFGPILLHYGETFDAVIPTGGSAAGSLARLVVIERIESACAGDDGSAVLVGLRSDSPRDVVVEVRDRGAVIGSAPARIDSLGTTGVLVEISFMSSPSAAGEIVIRDASDPSVLQRAPFDHTAQRPGCV